MELVGFECWTFSFKIGGIISAHGHIIYHLKEVQVSWNGQTIWKTAISGAYDVAAKRNFATRFPGIPMRHSAEFSFGYLLLEQHYEIKSYTQLLKLFAGKLGKFEN